MADVAVARTEGIEGFERHVVVKRIRAEHAKDQRFIQMFLDEARVAAGLHHQNIVQVHDIGEANGEYYFAMEYIHGEDLRKILSTVSKSKTHMPLGYVVSIITGAAAGLHYAHERRGADKKPLNIVHRDVSPSNILVGYDGAVKVVDFGIAKAAMRQVETRSGSLKGKVSYMSPEQCKGDGVDRRSDVYALGVVLYELATTTRLFKGDNDYLLMDAIVNGKVPLPRVRRADLPNELSMIIMRALSVDPDSRYQTADELRIALDQYAIKAGLTAATSALAGYMHKLYGEKPEPWLDSSGETAVDARPIAFEATPEMARSSWTEMPRSGIEAAAEAAASAAADRVLEEAKTRSDGKRNRGPAVEPPGDSIPPPMTRTSTKMGWEHQGQLSGQLPPAPPRRAMKLALLGIPALAIAGIAVWQLALMGGDHVPVVATHTTIEPTGTLEPTPTPIAATAALPAPTPTDPAPAVTPPAPPAAAVTPSATAPAVPAMPPSHDVTVAHPPAKVAPAPPAPPAPPPAAPAPAIAKKEIKKPETKATPAPTPSAAPAPTPSPAAVTTAPLPTPAPTPAVVAPAAPPTETAAPEATVTALSQATISAVASDHGRQLSKCEGTAELHGEVSIAFQVDASGHVIKSQMSTSIKNPKVSGCILKNLTGWQFPKPASGAAKGVYSISYQ